MLDELEIKADWYYEIQKSCETCFRVFYEYEVIRFANTYFCKDCYVSLDKEMPKCKNT